MEIDESSLLAVLFLVVGALGIGVSFLVPNPYSRTLPVVMLVAALLFFLTRRGTASPPVINNPAWILGAIYFLGLAATFSLYRFGGHQRTLAVHVAVLGCYVTVAALLFTPISRHLKLLAVIVTGVVQRALGYYSSPLYLGSDVSAHNSAVEQISAVYSLAPVSTSRYFYAPFYYLLVSIQQNVAGVSVRHAAFISIAIVQVGVLAGALYLITGRLWNDRTALLSALLYTASDFGNHWGMTPQVTSLGIAFFALIFLLLVLYMESSGRRYYALYTIAFVAIALTHHLSTAVAYAAITIYLTVWTVLKPDSWVKAFWAFAASTVISLVDFQVTQFGGPGSGSESFLMTVVDIWRTSLRDATLPGGGDPVLRADAAVTLTGSAALDVWHVAGTAILFGMAIFGWLHWIADESVSPKAGVAFGSIVGVLFPIVLAGPAFGLRILIPWRWFAFIYFPLVILAAPGFVVLIRIAHDRFRRVSDGASKVAVIAVIVLLIGPYLFLMGGNALAARDGPPLDTAPGAERYAVTDAEYATLEHSVRYAPRDTPLVGDFMMANNLLDRYYGLSNARTIHMETLDPNSIGEDERAILLDRRYMRSGHVKFRYGTEEGIGNVEGLLVHGVVPVEEVDPSRWEVIYSTGETELVYLAPAPADNRSADRTASFDPRGD